MSTCKELVIALPCPLLCCPSPFFYCFQLSMRQQQAAEMPIGEVFVPKQQSLGCFDNLISICKTLFWCHIMSPGHPAGMEEEKGMTVLK